MLKPRVKSIRPIFASLQHVCLLAVDISQTLVFLINIIIIIIILYRQHRPSSIPRTLSIEVTISRSTRYVITAAFPSLSTSPRISQRRRHTNAEKQKSQKKHYSPFRSQDTCKGSVQTLGTQRPINILRRSCDTADADAVYLLYQPSIYACIACILRIIPHPAPTSGMIQCNLVCADQPYHKSPTGMSTAPGTVRGTQYSGAMAPPAFLWGQAQIRSVIRPPPCAAMV